MSVHPWKRITGKTSPRLKSRPPIFRILFLHFKKFWWKPDPQRLPSVTSLQPPILSFSHFPISYFSLSLLSILKHIRSNYYCHWCEFCEKGIRSYDITGSQNIRMICITRTQNIKLSGWYHWNPKLSKYHWNPVTKTEAWGWLLILARLGVGWELRKPH